MPVQTMESQAKLHHRPQQLQLSLSQISPPFLLRPVSFVSFRTLPSLFPLSHYHYQCSRNHQSKPHLRQTPLCKNPRSSKAHLLQTLDSLTSSFVKTTCIAITAAAAAFFVMKFHQKPALSVPSSPATAESKLNDSDEEAERMIVEYVATVPTDIEALRTLMEIKIGARKFGEAIGILDRLIDLDPTEYQWPLLKAHMHLQNDEPEMAKQGFEEILKKDPYRIEAYHGDF